MKVFIKIALSIVIGFSLLRFGYEAKNDTASIVVQSLGYVSVSYPFILFIKVFIDQIKYDIKNRNND